jgi:large subunit ribosomal protein L22
VIKTIFVDGARTLKRMRPAPQGRGYRVRKRSNHVTVIVDDFEAVLASKQKQPKAETVPVVEEETEVQEKTTKKAASKKAATKKAAPKKAAKKTTTKK